VVKRDDCYCYRMRARGLERKDLTNSNIIVGNELVGIWVKIHLNSKTRFDLAFIIALLQQFNKIGIEVKTAHITDDSLLNKID
jgi:hypothetical protein